MSRSLALQGGTPELLSATVLTHPKLLIMSDYDGTLVPIREQPEFAVPGSGLLKVIKRLAQKRRVAFAVISGRDTADLKRLLPINGIYLAGCHGAEIAGPTGEILKTANLNGLCPVLQSIADKASAVAGTEQGFIIERKKAAVALHYRLADPASALDVLNTFVTAVRPLLTRFNLELMTGKKVVEIRPRGINKGGAVQFLIRRCPGYFPVYIGDDTTDEDGFKEVQSGGLGVLVAEHRKITAATHLLRGPQDVLRFLQIIAARC